MLNYDPTSEIEYRRERLARSYRAGVSRGVTSAGDAGRPVRRHHHLPRLRSRSNA